MACTVNTGRTTGVCKNVVGGIRNLFIWSYDRDFGDNCIESGGQINLISGMGFGDTITVYPWGVNGMGGSFTETSNTSADTGQTFYEQTITAKFPKLSGTDDLEFRKMTQGRVHVLVETYQMPGTFYVFGRNFGMIPTVNKVSGASMGDFQGYEVTFNATERDQFLKIDGSLFDVSTQTTPTDLL